MPIEFRCPGCSKLLRTPDESAGKKAKCPQCGTIADVPLSSTPSSGPSPSPTQSAEPLPPFGPSASGAAPGKPQDSPFGGPVNPYASPAPDYTTTTAARGAMVHSRISFDQILANVWELFKQQMGAMALFGVVIFGINLGLQVIGQGGGAAVAQTNDQAIIGVFTILNTLFGMLVQTWVNIGSALYMLKAARHQSPTINELGRAGPYFLRVILLQIVIGLATFGIFVVCLAPAGVAYLITGQQEVGVGVAIIGVLVAILPAVYIVYRWFIAMYFVVDRNLGVMDSLAQSAQFMVGNKLQAFLIMLVVGFLGTLFGFLTCCIGFVLVIPYISLVTTALYLSATGQPWGATRTAAP